MPIGLPQYCEHLETYWLIAVVKTRLAKGSAHDKNEQQLEHECWTNKTKNWMLQKVGENKEG